MTTVLSVVGLLVWLGYEVVLRRRAAETSTWSGGADDRGSTRLLLVAYAVAVAINIAAGRAELGFVARPLRWAGVALLAGGLVLRARAMVALQGFYTRTVRTVARHRLVEDGPYRVIRHPGYAGSLLVWVGYSLGLGSWIATVLVAVLLAAVYAWRISVEEQVLAAAFGTEWSAYRSHTKRLVPFLY